MSAIKTIAVGPPVDGDTIYFGVEPKPSIGHAEALTLIERFRNERRDLRVALQNSRNILTGLWGDLREIESLFSSTCRDGSTRFEAQQKEVDKSYGESTDLLTTYDPLLS